MHPQLQAIRTDLTTATAQAQALWAAHPVERLRQRPAGGGWSAAECLAHLNLTAAAYEPALAAAVQQALALPVGAPRRFRRGMWGWLIWQAVSPSGAMKSTTMPPFVPTAADDPAPLLKTFERAQAHLVHVLETVAPHAIDRVMVVSAFNPRISYNLYATLGILARHALRHLNQAARALGHGAR